MRNDTLICCAAGAIAVLAVAAGCGVDLGNQPDGQLGDLLPGDGGGDGLSYEPIMPAAGCVQPAALTKSCSAGFCSVPKGCFLMGSPSVASCRDDDEERHWVALTHAFEISSNEITQHQFKAALGYNPSSFTSCGGACPVDTVTWHEAVAYTNSVSSGKGLATCYTCSGVAPAVTCKTKPEYESAGKTIYSCPGYRLPTEAEWEYSYGAGSVGTYYVGDAIVCDGADTVAGTIGWNNKNSNKSTHPGGQKQPNAWGLSDMAGNLEEWVHDGYGLYPKEFVTDPILPLVDETKHSARGGSWFATSLDMRGADRNSFNGKDSEPYHGFRVVRTK